MKSVYRILIAVVISSTFLGCTTSEQLLVREAKLYNNPSEFLILHTLQKKYKLTDYEFKGDTLQGKLEKCFSTPGYNMHVYLYSRDYLNLDKQLNQHVKVTSDEIDKITWSKTHAGKTILAVAGGTLGLLTTFSVITFFSTPWFSF